MIKSALICLCLLLCAPKEAVCDSLSSEVTSWELPGLKARAPANSPEGLSRRQSALFLATKLAIDRMKLPEFGAGEGISASHLDSIIAFAADLARDVEASGDSDSARRIKDHIIGPFKGYQKLKEELGRSECGLARRLVSIDQAFAADISVEEDIQSDVCRNPLENLSAGEAALALARNINQISATRPSIDQVFADLLYHDTRDRFLETYGDHFWQTDLRDMAPEELFRELVGKDPENSQKDREVIQRLHQIKDEIRKDQQEKYGTGTPPEAQIKAQIEASRKDIFNDISVKIETYNRNNREREISTARKDLLASFSDRRNPFGIPLSPDDERGNPGVFIVPEEKTISFGQTPEGSGEFLRRLGGASWILSPPRPARSVPLASVIMLDAAQKAGIEIVEIEKLKKETRRGTLPDTQADRVKALFEAHEELSRQTHKTTGRAPADLLPDIIQFAATPSSTERSPGLVARLMSDEKPRLAPESYERQYAANFQSALAQRRSKRMTLSELQDIWQTSDPSFADGRLLDEKIRDDDEKDRLEYAASKKAIQQTLGGGSYARHLYIDAPIPPTQENIERAIQRERSGLGKAMSDLASMFDKMKEAGTEGERATAEEAFIKHLLRFNPASIGKLLLKYPTFVGQVCAAWQRLEEERKSEEKILEAYRDWQLNTGGAAIATGAMGLLLAQTPLGGPLLAYSAGTGLGLSLGSAAVEGKRLSDALTQMEIGTYYLRARAESDPTLVMEKEGEAADALIQFVLNAAASGFDGAAVGAIGAQALRRGSLETTKHLLRTMREQDVGTVLRALRSTDELGGLVNLTRASQLDENRRLLSAGTRTPLSPAERLTLTQERAKAALERESRLFPSKKITELNDEERLAEIEYYLTKDARDRELIDAQDVIRIPKASDTAKRLLEAHKTQSVFEKGRNLYRSGLSQNQRRLLIENGLIGDEKFLGHSAKLPEGMAVPEQPLSHTLLDIAQPRVAEMEGVVWIVPGIPGDAGADPSSGKAVIGLFLYPNKKYYVTTTDGRTFEGIFVKAKSQGTEDLGLAFRGDDDVLHGIGPEDISDIYELSPPKDVLRHTLVGEEIRPSAAKVVPRPVDIKKPPAFPALSISPQPEAQVRQRFDIFEESVIGQKAVVRIREGGFFGFGRKEVETGMFQPVMIFDERGRVRGAGWLMRVSNEKNFLTLSKLQPEAIPIEHQGLRIVAKKGATSRIQFSDIGDMMPLEIPGIRHDTKIFQRTGNLKPEVGDIVLMGGERKEPAQILHINKSKGKYIVGILDNDGSVTEIDPNMGIGNFSRTFDSSLLPEGSPLQKMVEELKIR